MIPRAIIDDQPKPLCFNTFTGMIVALGATPLIGVPRNLYPMTVLVTCVPWEFWSCSQTLGWDGTAPLFMAPPPPWNARANCVAMRSAGEYDRQLSRRPVSSMPTHTPSPVKPEAFRVDVKGLTVAFHASICHA